MLSCPLCAQEAHVISSPQASNVKCGVRGLDDKIVGGEDAPLGAWPWMVILRGRG